MWVTGGNNFGQLGNGTKKNQYEPIKLNDLKDIKHVSAWHYTAAITNKNELFVWGTGIFGEYLTPKLMNFKNLPNVFEHVSVGGSFTTLIDNRGKLLVWGANTNGELGLGDT